LRVRKAGIKVPLNEEYKKNNINYGEMWIGISILQDSWSEAYLYNLNIYVGQWCYLYQDVFTKRGKVFIKSEAEPIWAIVWETGYYGLNTNASEILAILMKCVDKLINDYLAVNL
jgi:hypothetical protein